MRWQRRTVALIPMIIYHFNNYERNTKMYVTTEITEYNIYDELWSGGRETLDDLTDDQIATVLNMLEETVSPDFSLTDLNDFFWFERDTIAEWLGYDSYDDLMNDNGVNMAIRG